MNNFHHFADLLQVLYWPVVLSGGFWTGSREAFHLLGNEDSFSKFYEYISIHQKIRPVCHHSCDHSLTQGMKRCVEGLVLLMNPAEYSIVGARCRYFIPVVNL